MARTESGDDLLSQQVEDLWGSAHYQRAPTITLETIQKDGDQEKRVITPVDVESSDIRANFQLRHRRKGLLWYSTYDVDFDAAYTFRNPLNTRAQGTVTFYFPASSTIYDAFDFRVGEMDIVPTADNSDDGIKAVVEVPPGAEVPIHIAYKSRGLDRWIYSFSDGINTVSNFSLKAATDFSEYDFPEETISASTKTPTNNGCEHQTTNFRGPACVGRVHWSEVTSSPSAARSWASMIVLAKPGGKTLRMVLPTPNRGRPVDRAGSPST